MWAILLPPRAVHRGMSILIIVIVIVIVTVTVMIIIIFIVVRERENILYLRDIHRKSHHDKENTAELIAHPIGVISA